jgi:hypothetical protein
MVAGVLSRVQAPPTIPAEATESMAPLHWLLERAAGDGVPLTEAYRLPPALLVEAQQWFGLDPTPAGSDGCLGAVRDLLESARALRRTGRRLVLTRLGRQLLAEPSRLWERATGALVGPGDGLGPAAREAALLVLVARQTGREELVRRVGEAVTGEGWLDPGGHRTRCAVAELLRQLHALGLLAEDRWLRPVRLTPAGQIAGVTALRRRALRPRRTLGSS